MPYKTVFIGELTEPKFEGDLPELIIRDVPQVPGEIMSQGMMLFSETDSGEFTPVNDFESVPDDDAMRGRMALTLAKALTGGDPSVLLDKDAFHAKADKFLAEHRSQVGFVTNDGRIVWGKLVPSRISDEGFTQWIYDWYRHPNLVRHHPFRPPDFDTPKNRGWTAHPGEDGFRAADLEEARKRAALISEKDESGDFPVYVLVMNIPQQDELGRRPVMKFLVQWQGHGENVYRLTVKYHRPSGEVAFDGEIVEADGDKIWDRLCEAVDTLMARLGSQGLNFQDDGADWLITDYEEWQEFLAESDRDSVMKDLADYYGLPWLAEKATS